MVPRKSGLPELELHPSGSEQPETDLPLAEQINTPARERHTDKVRLGAATKLLERIHAANAGLDKRRAAPVTIVIPAWLRNEQDVNWLIEALDSAIQQTVACKMIIVENGSEILTDLEGNVAIIHSDQGLSKARNAGIRACTTEFFFPLDANDWLPDNAIETAVRKMPAKGFLYGSTMLFNQARGMGDQHFYNARPYDFQEVMKMVYFPNGALQRKADWEAIGGYRESLPFLEDWDYWMTAGEKGICGTAIPEVLYWYRQHGGMVATNNHTPEWEQVKKLIQSYHQDIYRGVYPPMCCGNKASSATPYIPPAVQMLAPGADGMLLIQYIGGNVGKTTWYGPVSGARYIVNGKLWKFYIDARDALTSSRSNPGFLEIVDHGTVLFQQVEA